VTDVPNGPWFTCLPPCETLVPCGQGRHSVRWEAGELRLASHADPGAEARAGRARRGQGPLRRDRRGVAAAHRRPDRARRMARATPPPGSWSAGMTSPRPGRPPGAAAGAGGRPGPPGGWPARRPRRWPGPPSGTGQYQQEAGEASQRRLDMLSLLALGTGFQVRLRRAGGRGIRGPAGRAGRARADYPVGADRRAGRPAGAGGRAVARHRPGPGRGVVAPRGRVGFGRADRAGASSGGCASACPPGWLARVWACGLALTGGHLVVAV